METESFRELDDLGFLREAELFQDMPEAVIRAIMLQAQPVSLGPNSVVVRTGEPGESLFVVKTGVVEVVNPVEGSESLAYLGRGECFGELALLTGTPRSNEVRVPEQAELLVIDKALFDELMTNHSGFASSLAGILAYRLVKILQNLPSDSGKKQLQGSLRFFDLATVIQTLISSSQTGVMKVESSNEIVAQLHFKSGNIYRAHYYHRSGDEAVHHLFQAQPEGEFFFASNEMERGSPDPGITVPAMALMLESIRLQDELAALSEIMLEPDVVLTRLQRALSWSEPEGQTEARWMWDQVEKPMAFRDLLAASGSCHYHAASVLIALIESGQVGPASDPS